MILNLSMQQILKSAATGTLPIREVLQDTLSLVSLFTYLTLNNKLINNISFLMHNSCDEEQ